MVQQDGGQDEGDGHEDRGPDRAQVGEREDQGEDPDCEVGPGEAQHLQLLHLGLRLDAVQHGEVVGQPVAGVAHQRDDTTNLGRQTVALAVTVTLVVSVQLPASKSVTA